jgi:hypothetical protein
MIILTMSLIHTGNLFTPIVTATPLDI